jgi:hypothetical protein
MQTERKCVLMNHFQHEAAHYNGTVVFHSVAVPFQRDLLMREQN